MSERIKTDEEVWQELRRERPGAVATGEQTAWQARNFSARSFVYGCNLFHTRDLSYEEVRARYEELPVIDCTTPKGGKSLTLEEEERRIRLVREARDAGVPPPPHTVLEFNGW